MKTHLKLISFLNDYNRLKQKKIVVIVSEQRHGSTTLCQKINELPNTISLFEAFGNEGFFNDLTQTKHDLKLQMSKLVNGTSWLRGIDTISFKIFSDHGINLLDLVTLGLQMKVIFLRRNLRDSYCSLQKALNSGNWGTDPVSQVQNTGMTNYIKTNNTLNYDTYKDKVDAWFETNLCIAKKHCVNFEEVWFGEIIGNKFDVKKILHS